VKEGGKLITIVTSLLAAFTGYYTSYAGSKAPVEHFTRGVSKELAGKRISVNAIAPGPMDTRESWFICPFTILWPIEILVPLKLFNYQDGFNKEPGLPFLSTSLLRRYVLKSCLLIIASLSQQNVNWIRSQHFSILKNHQRQLHFTRTVQWKVVWQMWRISLLLSNFCAPRVSGSLVRPFLPMGDIRPAESSVSYTVYSKMLAEPYPPVPNQLSRVNLWKLNDDRDAPMP
jgi:hypothetical protein